jgi:hypothetical protein
MGGKEDEMRGEKVITNFKQQKNCYQKWSFLFKKGWGTVFG